MVYFSIVRSRVVELIHSKDSKLFVCLESITKSRKKDSFFSENFIEIDYS